MADKSAKASTEEATIGDKGEITPDLVRQVADKVYELWLHELAVERGRQRPFTR
jgi:hypothetical protein